MLKKLTVVLGTVVMVTSVAFSQASKAPKAQKANVNVQILDESKVSNASSFFTDYMNAKLHKTAVTPANGDTVLFSDYDYPANVQVRQMVDPYDFDGDGLLNPIAVATSRKPGSWSVPDFIYGDPTGYATTPAFDTVAIKANMSFGEVITPKAGPLKGKALIMARQSTALKSYFTTIDLATFTASAPVIFGGTAPSFTYAADGTIWANTVGDMKLYKSTDKGVTFNIVDDLKSYFPYYKTSTPSEIGIESSSDGKYLSMMGGFGIAGNGQPTLDSTDYVGWMHSENSGATWKMEKIAYDGYTNQIANRPNNVAWFQNFGHTNVAVDDKGVTHGVFLGYGYYDIPRQTDTLSYYGFPICYFNSTTKKVNAISPAAVDGDSLYDVALRGGNSMGLSYPTISASADGKNLFVAWQQPEYKGTTYGTGDYNIYPGDGSAVSGKVYYYDVWAVTSNDGGATWSSPVVIAGKKSVAECYPAAARKLDIKNGKATVTMLYFEDKIPGQSVLASSSALYNSRATGAWIYKTYTYSVPTAVENNSTVVNKFELEQNYPNPFNPTTQISYSLEKSGMVSLKVYNVLGKEIATLVNNKTEAAGKHTINFDGSNLTSGMYIYTLNSGNQVVSKKMMLVK